MHLSNLKYEFMRPPLPMVSALGSRRASWHRLQVGCASSGHIICGVNWSSIVHAWIGFVINLNPHILCMLAASSSSSLYQVPVPLQLWHFHWRENLRNGSPLTLRRVWWQINSPATLSHLWRCESRLKWWMASKYFPLSIVQSNSGFLSANRLNSAKWTWSMIFSIFSYRNDR